MPRVAKPYLEHGWYISRAGGRYLRLCPQVEGVRRAKKLLSERLKENKQGKYESKEDVRPGLSVSGLFKAFLDAVKAEKSEATFLDYRRWCVVFERWCGEKDAAEVSRLDAQRFKQLLLTTTYKVNNQPPRPYKPKSVNHALIALRRAFNWAIDGELLSRNPFAKLKLVPCQGRQRVATTEEYQALLAACTDQDFRDVLVAMRFTSARPGDIRALCWEMVNWDRHCWVLHDHKSSRTARNPKPRIIGMNAEVEAVLRRRQAERGSDGHAFLNRTGKPWTKNALGLRMRRLRRWAGVRPDARGEEFVLYTQRHSFLTQAAMHPGVTEAVLSELAGHSDSRTTRRYVHLADRVVAESGRKVADSLGEQLIKSAEK